MSLHGKNLFIPQTWDMLLSLFDHLVTMCRYDVANLTVDYATCVTAVLYVALLQDCSAAVYHLPSNSITHLCMSPSQYVEAGLPETDRR
jgi:hypothetical protein